MKVVSLGANKTELTTGNTTVLFSYGTPVAATVDGETFKTDCRWSKTTSKHITQWLDGRTASEKPQKFFDELIK